MKEYVLGFAFDSNKKAVVLILKNKPDWQKGKYNGVGGKVELSDESKLHAMIREFYEEAGCVTIEVDWSPFAEMIFQNDIMTGSAKIYCFRMFSDNIHECSTCEEEVIEICSLKNVYKRPLMHNLRILIPLALQTEFSYIILKQ